MKPEKNLSVVPGESRGIWAAIAKLMRRRSVIDIVERFQTKLALHRNIVLTQLVVTERPIRAHALR